MEDIEIKIKKIVSEQLGVPIDIVQNNSKFVGTAWILLKWFLH